MGDERVTQRGLRVAEVDAERNLLLVAGRRARGGRRHGRDQERRLMAALTAPIAVRRRRRQARRRRSSASSATTPLVHEVVTAELAARRQGTHVDQDPRPGRRRPRQAVAPEGHRPCPPGHDPRPAVGRRRRRLRPAPAQLHRQGQPQGARQGAADRALGPRRRRQPGDGGRRQVRRAEDEARAVELLGRLARPSARWWSSSQRGEDALARSFRNLERTHVVEVGELEVADLVWARSLIVSKAALALLEGGEAE